MVEVASSRRSPSLPTPRTRLIGREAERATARAFLVKDAVPLLTLTGPGGVGKTRLALAIAQDVAPHFPDGVIWVDLAPLADAALVPAAIAEAVHLPALGDAPVLARLQAFVRDRALLLLLDNCEHLIAAAPVVAALLSACPALRVLATSRRRLRIAGEQVFTVPPLSCAAADDLRARPTEAMQLFAARVAAAQPGFALTEQTAPVVSAICTHLDGLPLAIELAAARCTVLSPDGLLARLERRLPLLTGGTRDAPARQQTMRDAIAWSFDLLTPPEQALFRRLSVCVGGWTLEAAEAVTWSMDERACDVLEGVSALLEASLLHRTDVPTGEPRFAMLEMVREFGLACLERAGERHQTQRRHADYFLALCEAARQQPEPRDWRVVQADYANVRAALAWITEQQEPELSFRFIAALWWFWRTRGYVDEGRTWIEHALHGRAGTPRRDRVFLLVWQAELAMMQGDVAAAVRGADEALLLARQGDPVDGLTEALFQRGWIALHLDDATAAATFLTEALTVARCCGDPTYLPTILDNLGTVARRQGRLDPAQTFYEQALAESRRLRYAWGIAEHFAHLAGIAADRGDYAQAAMRYQESLAQAEAHGGDTRNLAGTLAGFARVIAASGEPRRAARLYGAATALHAAAGVRPSVVAQLDLERAASLIETQIGPAAFAAEREQGAAMTFTAALSEARLPIPGLPSTHVPSPRAGLERAASPRLTRREREVLHLVAEGRSNRAIAEALHISVPTVKRHLATIYGKLNVSSRTAAAIYAHTHQLVS